MGLIVASGLCLALWVVLWCFHIAARDAAMISFSLFLVAAAVRTVGEQVRQSNSREG
ncbi:MAG: hypothetical protein J7513_11960 [Solirubrobacteraceae bacterium]|nr:hypothetical protein [Solirubrobacteraceae bacterium]